jgi:hypothetical protein
MPQTEVRSMFSCEQFPKMLPAGVKLGLPAQHSRRGLVCPFPHGEAVADYAASKSKKAREGLGKVTPCFPARRFTSRLAAELLGLGCFHRQWLIRKGALIATKKANVPDSVKSWDAHSTSPSARDAERTLH